MSGLGPAPGNPAANRPVRILASGSLARGGVQSHILGLCQALREAHAEVTLAAVGNDWSAAETARLHDLGCRLVTTPFDSRSRMGKLFAFATWPWRLERSFDVMYAFGHGRMHEYTKRFLAPGGFSIYHEIVEAPPNADHIAIRLALQMDAIIVNSKFILEPFHVLTPEHPIRAIQAFAAKVRREPVQRPPVGERPIRVAYVGRVATHKQTDWLVKEWTSIAATPPLSPARLDVHGNDEPSEPLIDKLRQYVREQGAADCVTLHGEYHPSRIAAILADVDVVVLPSLWDAVPLVLVEAMQCGVPIVAMATGGIAEIAVDNPDVEITPARDKLAFVQGLQRMAAKLRSGAIDSARLQSWVEARYGYEVLARQWARALTRPREFFDLAGCKP